MASEKDWVDVLSALLTPVVAMAAVAIAVLQWRINRNRLKHELFDRRYEQYKSVTNFLGSIMGSGKATIEAQREYLNGTIGMEFTFSMKVCDYLHQNVWCRAIDLECVQSEFEGLPVGRERSRLAHRAADLKKQLYAEFKHIDDVFRPYLQLSH